MFADPAHHSSEHDYYQSLCQSLEHEELSFPALIIDQERLDHNLSCLKRWVPENWHYRIVAKSLPCPELLRYVMNATQSNRLMCFHLPFLLDLVAHFPTADILIGKPFPLTSLKQFYRQVGNTTFDPEHQLQWLVDSYERLREYEALACSNDLTLTINFEIDIGLHRGGLESPEVLEECLQFALGSEHIRIGGLMGYEAHVAKMPAILGGQEFAFHIAHRKYQAFSKMLSRYVPDLESSCLNTGGSPTLPYYGQSHRQWQACQHINELSAGSCLVKPSDFDSRLLTELKPAAFIAAPILKHVEKVELPGPNSPPKSLLTKAFKKAGVLPQRAAYIYGGNWLADAIFPEGSQQLKLFGHSSNQEMYGLPNSAHSTSYMLFRPKQSEALFLQFGRIGMYKNGHIENWWPTMSYPENLYNSI